MRDSAGTAVDSSTRTGWTAGSSSRPAASGPFWTFSSSWISWAWALARPELSRSPWRRPARHRPRPHVHRHGGWPGRGVPHPRHPNRHALDEPVHPALSSGPSTRPHSDAAAAAAAARRRGGQPASAAASAFSGSQMAPWSQVG